MKAFIRNNYGGPEVLQLQEVDKPIVKDGCILVRVLANSANPADWHILRGKPFFARFTFGLFKPKEKIAGCDFAGIVDQVGNNVTHFKVGQPVFGESLMGGAFAEYVCIPEDFCAIIPEGVGFPEMAGLPTAGLTAWQALTTHGKIKKGETVLINGSSGGVGHFAVQLAKALGAQVTAICSSRNIDFVRSLGADHVVAYDIDNIHLHSVKYDLVLDVNGNLSYADFRRMGKRGVMVGFTTMRHMISVLFKRAFGKFPLVSFTANANSRDLKELALLMQDGRIRTCIDKYFNYKEIPAAIGYIEDMRTRGKVVMLWNEL
ncbi:NAD(P)-dependent alcohol dehydrogenase [Flavihumibacter rivuli]|uniref:NAD(P)-dependent alcohol dehydrogenase n=1 Tax=Flavihumibacter rivuli TaxID=2838156 RepID=UPI001BDF1372|nr:NAD(P)-dependent alcohol dehydrogenase [Flavihumibacter rivuli]ULQ55244.1 NAD(P)-dependent alcohol dehydrogenase [Flavihumibacter rivuli]